MNYTERPNLEACQYLFSILSADFVKLYRDKDDHTFSKIKKYLQSVLKQGELKIDYSKSKYDTLGVLRSYSNGIQGLPKEMRGFICDNMIDYDIKNCHPTILLNLCNKYKLNALYLKKFCDERDDLYDTEQITKKIVMCCMFSDKQIKGTPFTCAFDAELKQIQQQLIPLYPDLYEMAKQKDGKNVIGTFVSYVCQFYENKIINACSLHFKVEVAVLMFDGFMAYSSHNVEELSTFVKERFDMDLQWIIKPHFTNIKIPEGWKSDNLALLYDTMKQKYEADYGLSYIVKNVTYSYKINDEICFYSKDECSRHFDNVFIGGVSFFKMWNADPEKQTYNDIGVFPNDVKCPDDILNLWTGFHIEKYPSELCDIEPILELIRILVNRDEASYQFLLQWIANMFQYPSSPSILVALCSINEGAGKGSLVNLLAEMIGRDKYAEVNDPEKQLFGSFNGHLTNTVLCNIDECKRGNMVQFYDRMKNMINSPINEVHNKGQKAYSIANVRHYLATFNAPDSLALKEGSRRYFMTYCSEEKIGDTSYFDTLHRFIEKKNVQYSFYRYLMELPTKRRFSQSDIPITDMMREAIEVNRDPIENYIIEFRSGCDSDELYSEYKDFIRQSGLKEPLSKTSFMMRFSRLMDKHKITSKPTDKVTDGVRKQMRIYTRTLLLAV
jgi:hypothetical protein